MQVNISANIAEVTKDLRRIEKKQIPWSIKLALDETAKRIAKDKGQGVMGRAADKTFSTKSGGKGATNFTTRGFFYKQATKQNLTSEVFFSEDRGDFMELQVFGGTRFPRKRTITHSTKNSHKYLDRYGNFKKGAIDTMLKDKTKFFTGVPHGAQFESEGIWERYGRGSKQGGQRIRMVAALLDQAEYRPLFPFFKIGEHFVFNDQKGFTPIFRERLEWVLRREGLL